MSPADFGRMKNMRGYWGENVGNNTYTKFPANVFLVGKSIGLFMGYQLPVLCRKKNITVRRISSIRSR